MDDFFILRILRNYRNRFHAKTFTPDFIELWKMNSWSYADFIKCHGEYLSTIESKVLNSSLFLFLYLTLAIIAFISDYPVLGFLFSVLLIRQYHKSSQYMLLIEFMNINTMLARISCKEHQGFDFNQAGLSKFISEIKESISADANNGAYSNEEATLENNILREQVASLSSSVNENIQLRNQLDTLLRTARINEKKQELFMSAGLDALSAKTLCELLELLILSIPTRFQWDMVTIAIIGDELLIKQLLNNCDNTADWVNKIFIFDSNNNAHEIIALDNDVKKGPEIIDMYGWMNESLEGRELLNSAAYVPLISKGVVIGGIFIGSNDIRYFQSTHGSDYLRMLSAMVAISFENIMYHHRIKK